MVALSPTFSFNFTIALLQKNGQEVSLHRREGKYLCVAAPYQMRIFYDYFILKSFQLIIKLMQKFPLKHLVKGMKRML